MSLNTYDSSSGTLTNIASSSRIWTGTKAEWNALVQAGTAPRNVLVAITDDEIEPDRRIPKAWTDASAFKEAISASATDQNLAAHNLAIGDYYDDTNYKYIVADMDTFYGGYDANATLAIHHIGVLVQAKGINIKWGDNTTTGYSGSYLHQYLENTVLPAVQNFFGSSNILTHKIAWTTSPTSWNWTNQVAISALTEVQVVGSAVWSLNGFQQGEGVKKLAIFDKFLFNQFFGSGFWLRSLSSTNDKACRITYDALASESPVTELDPVAGLILVK